MSKVFKNIATAIVSLIIIFVSVFFVWTGDYYHAEQAVIAMYEGDKSMYESGEYTVINPEEPNNTGIIFYPGAKVEAISYLPLLDKLSEEGYTVILCEMPFNLAFLGVDKADAAIELFSEEIEDVYIAGHSLGSAMATSYAVENMEKVEGLIILGGYIYKDYPAEDALTIYGSLDPQDSKIDYEENIVVIEGGNHAQFGNYGEQDGDVKGEISADKQQDLTVEAIVDFIKSRK